MLTTLNDPGDARDHGRGPPAPAHRGETCAGVSALHRESNERFILKKERFYVQNVSKSMGKKLTHGRRLKDEVVTGSAVQFAAGHVQRS